MQLFCGDNIEHLKSIPDNSVDSVVTDPPYGLKFMGKQWDYDVPTVELWREVLRVLKPGGHLLSFGGTRTYHRMTVNIEDAGFEIRDQIQWIYGSGFPKSQDISKAIDKQAGAEREVIGQQNYSAPDIRGDSYDQPQVSERERLPVNITAPATDAAKQWQGWGTALKPANEPICMARKPIEKGLTIAENVQKYGTGAINVDGGRIGTEQVEKGRAGRGIAESTSYHNGLKPTEQKEFVQGRWPANVLFDEDAAAVLDEQSGVLKSGALSGNEYKNGHRGKTIYGEFKGFEFESKLANSGGASRFFYVAKASKSERNAGLEGMPEIAKPLMGEFKENPGRTTPKSSPAPRANHHPTVKPIKLIQYLVKLVTPPGGTVLDPFMGSGSTGVAALKDSFDFIGMELSQEYFEIAKRRIETAQTKEGEQ